MDKPWYMTPKALVDEYAKDNHVISPSMLEGKSVEWVCNIALSLEHDYLRIIYLGAAMREEIKRLKKLAGPSA